MEYIFPILFIALNLSIGVKLGLVYRERYPSFSRNLLLAAGGQVLLLIIPASRAPGLMILMAILVLIGFGTACLFDWLKPLKIDSKKR